jgi:hypothetical protein
VDRENRVLLIEHLDAIGAAIADARVRAAALRAAGCDVEVVVLDASEHDDLLYPARMRRNGPGVEVYADDVFGRELLRKRLARARGERVLWASATPGGGDAARLLPAGITAHWWASGHAPSHGISRGPLEPLWRDGAPCSGSLVERESGGRSRLSLWDGVFLLAPAPLGREGGKAIIDAFADAVSDRDEMDLVVCGHASEALEAHARTRGVSLRVHFVGPAPREAEAAWLATATAAVVCGEVPLSGGLLLRALASGCPILPTGYAAEPIARWLTSQGNDWHRGRTLTESLAAALDRTRVVQDARERGREVAAAHSGAALTARLVAALGSDEVRAA